VWIGGIPISWRITSMFSKSLFKRSSARSFVRTPFSTFTWILWRYYSIDMEYLQFWIVKGVTWEINGFSFIRNFKTDAWDCMEWVEELKVGTIYILLISNNSRPELKQFFHKLFWHSRHSWILPQKRIHDRRRRNYLQKINQNTFKKINLNFFREQQLLKGPRIVIRMTVTDYNPLNERTRNSLLLKLVSHKRWRINHYAPSIDPDDVARCITMWIEAMWTTKDCNPKGRRDKHRFVYIFNVLIFFLITDILQELATGQGKPSIFSGFFKSNLFE
jgi:hypothetical protein